MFAYLQAQKPIPSSTQPRLIRCFCSSLTAAFKGNTRYNCETLPFEYRGLFAEYGLIVHSCMHIVDDNLFVLKHKITDDSKQEKQNL